MGSSTLFAIDSESLSRRERPVGYTRRSRFYCFPLDVHTVMAYTAMGAINFIIIVIVIVSISFRFIIYPEHTRRVV